MKDLDIYLDGHGVEGISNHGKTLALYVNMGDTYDATVIADLDEGKVIIGSWGNWVERYEAETGEQLP